MGIDLTSQDFEACHRVGGEGRGRGKRAIIAKFSNRKTAERVLRSRKSLKSTGIGISEDLTQMNYRLLTLAKDVRGLADCWTRQGSLFVKTEKGEVKKITCERELNAIQDSSTTSINDKRARYNRR